MLTILLNVLQRPCTQIALRKSVRIRSFSGLYFPAFGLYTEIYTVNLSIQSEYEKMRIRKIMKCKSSSAAVLAASPDRLGPHGSVQVSTLYKPSADDDL